MEFSSHGDFILHQKFWQLQLTATFVSGMTTLSRNVALLKYMCVTVCNCMVGDV